MRVQGTTHQRPIGRSAKKARTMVPTAGQASFLPACVRDHVVTDDWLEAIHGNRYSVPLALIGRTVLVVRRGGCRAIRHRGELVADHPVLAGRAPDRATAASVMPCRERRWQRRYSTCRARSRYAIWRSTIYKQLGGSERLEVTPWPPGEQSSQHGQRSRRGINLRKIGSLRSRQCPRLPVGGSRLVSLEGA